MYVDAKYVLKSIGKTIHPTKRGTDRVSRSKPSCQAEFSYDYPKEPPKYLREMTLPTPVTLELLKSDALR
jgi:hypothetical protein